MKKTYLFMQMAMLASVFSANCKLYGGCQLALPDKSLYKGECKNGIPNGKGIKFFVENGTCLKGNFVNNVLDGECEIDFNDDGYFKGECKNGEPNGFGERVYPNVGVFTGNFKGEVFEGNMTNYKGDTYIGRFVNRMLQGRGKIIFNGGGYIEAEFENNKPNGKVVRGYPDNSTYIGGFKNGKFDGEGYLTTRDGDTHAGYFVDGLQQREGKITDKYGNVLYEGNFVNGRITMIDKILWKIKTTLVSSLNKEEYSILNEGMSLLDRGDILMLNGNIYYVTKENINLVGTVDSILEKLKTN